MVLAPVVGGEHPINERAIELDSDEGVDGAVLEHLEAADRPPELLPQLDVLEGDIESRSGQADELDRGTESQKLLQLGGQPSCLRAGGDHLCREDMNAVEGEPARGGSVDIALGHDRGIAARDPRY